jgi:hypothetical protein
VKIVLHQASRCQTISPDISNIFRVIIAEPFAAELNLEFIDQLPVETSDLELHVLLLSLGQGVHTATYLSRS